MSREITSHKVNGLNERITIDVLDEPGPGGACHRYRMEGPRSQVPNIGMVPSFQTEIRFQQGAVSEPGSRDGTSNEALLAILIDRLEGFQRGKYPCNENMITLTKLVEAMHWLQHRTHERVARGVEGTHTP